MTHTFLCSIADVKEQCIDRRCRSSLSRHSVVTFGGDAWVSTTRVSPDIVGPTRRWPARWRDARRVWDRTSRIDLQLSGRQCVCVAGVDLGLWWWECVVCPSPLWTCGIWRGTWRRVMIFSFLEERCVFRVVDVSAAAVLPLLRSLFVIGSIKRTGATRFVLIYYQVSSDILIRIHLLKARCSLPVNERLRRIRKTGFLFMYSCLSRIRSCLRQICTSLKELHRNAIETLDIVMTP